MTDIKRLVMQGRAIIVLLVLILVVQLQPNGEELGRIDVAQLSAAAAAVVYALRAVVQKTEASE